MRRIYIPPRNETRLGALLLFPAWGTALEIRPLPVILYFTPLCKTYTVRIKFDKMYMFF